MYQDRSSACGLLFLPHLVQLLGKGFFTKFLIQKAAYLSMRLNTIRTGGNLFREVLKEYGVLLQINVVIAGQVPSFARDLLAIARYPPRMNVFGFSYCTAPHRNRLESFKRLSPALRAWRLTGSHRSRTLKGGSFAKPSLPMNGSFYARTSRRASIVGAGCFRILRPMTKATDAEAFRQGSGVPYQRGRRFRSSRFNSCANRCYFACY